FGMERVWARVSWMGAIAQWLAAGDSPRGEGDREGSPGPSPRETRLACHPSRLSPKRRRHQSWVKSCAHTAIIPTNSVSDASAAASSTKIFNMTASIYENICGTLFLFCSVRQGEKLHHNRQR